MWVFFFFFKKYNLELKEKSKKKKKTTTTGTTLNHGFSLVEKDGALTLSFSYVNDSLSHYVLTTQGDLELRY